MRIFLDSFAILVVYFWLKFIIAFLKIQDQKYSKGIAAISLFMLLLNASPGFISEIAPKYVFNYYVVAGPGYYIFAGYFSLLIIIGLFNLLKKIRQATPLEKIQIKYILFGSLLGFIGGGSTFLLSFGLPIPPYPFILFSSFPLVIAYAIARHRLMNIRRLLARSLLYFLTIAFVSSVFAFTGFFTAEVLQQPGRYSRMVIFMVVSFAVVVLLDPLKRYLTKVTDDIFYKNKIDYQKVLRDLSIIIAKEIDLEILLSTLRRAMMEDLKLKAADIMVDKKHQFVSLTVVGKKFETESPLIEYLQEHKDIVITDEMYRITSDLPEGTEHARHQHVLDELERNGIEFCMPVFLEGDLKAIIILGQKQSGDIYTTEDVRFFGTLSPQIAVAIEKSQLYESIGEFNIQLQEKINRATKKLKEFNTQLQDANAHLKQLDTAKSEFLSIASHQLRTPISALKGYLSMLIEGDFGKLDPKQAKVINDLFESASRLARLINIFLNVSRIESGRFKLDRTDVDINVLIDSVVKELQGQVNAKKLTLSFEKLKHPVLMHVDSDKIREVILNLVDNAIKYTQKGSIAMRTFIEDGNYNFLVKDTGIGIHREDAPGLFKKFVRGTGIAQVNTQGSGLGLYIAQRVIAEHGGKILAESDGYGKGSVFRFSLPVKDNQKENFSDAARAVAGVKQKQIRENIIASTE